MPVKNKFYQKIHGWCTYEVFYESMVHSFPDGSKFVEVGSWHGRSICFLATVVKENNRKIELHCVDTWAGTPIAEPDYVGWLQQVGGPDGVYTKFLSHIKKCGVEDIVTPHKMPSLEGAKLFEDKSLDFVFIDAAHDYTSVCNDITAWLPKVKDGGVLAGHDYDFPQIKKAVHDILGVEKVRDTGEQVCWVYQC